MIHDALWKTIRTYRLLEPRETVVVGVSGGPDSLALLFLLSSLKAELKLSLHVAHLDHSLRKNSRADLEFVAALAQKLKLPFTAKTVTLENSSEESARTARLAFLFEVAGKVKADKIALGHTLDDQAETVLMRLIRGTGLLGLAAIVPIRQFGRFTVIRPMLEIPRAQIERYLRKKKISPRIDQTNSRDIYLRNRIRKELLPLLEKKYNRNIKELLGNTALTAGYDYDFLLKAAKKAAGGGAKPMVDLASFARMHPSLQRIALRLAAQSVQGDTRRLTSQHIREIEDLARNRPTGSIVDLPKNISVVKRRKTLSFYLR